MSNAVECREEESRLNLFIGMTSVAQGVYVAYKEAVFLALANVSQATGDLAGNEGLLTTERTLVVEQMSLQAWTP